MRILVASCIAAVTICLGVVVGQAAEFSQFRGQTGQGVAAGRDLPLQWSESKNVDWKRPIPGKGWSSPVVADGRIWLTTAIEQAASDEQRDSRLRDLPPNKQRELRVVDGIELLVLSVDLATGDLLKTVKLFDVENPDLIHHVNSYASPTPVLDEGRVYCHFGTFGTACLDASSGDVIWSRRLPLEHGVGPGSSPIVFENLLVLVCDGTDKQYVTALEKSTGKTAWKTDRPPIRAERGDLRKAFSTPLLLGTGAQTQMVIPGAQWFISYDPTTGKELWRVDHGRGFSNVPRPVAGKGMVFLCTGFSKAQLWAIRTDGSGDVTSTHVAWKATKQVPHRPSPLVVGDELYMITDGGVATCLDVLTGDQRWTQRMPGKYSSSPLSVDGKIYFCSEEGKTTVIRPGTEYTELAQNHLDGQLMASPAVVGNKLLLRSDKALYRIAKQSAAAAGR